VLIYCCSRRPSGNVACTADMDTIDAVSIAVLVVYIFLQILAGFFGVYKTLRHSNRTGKQASAIGDRFTTSMVVYQRPLGPHSSDLAAAVAASSAADRRPVWVLRLNAYCCCRCMSITWLEWGCLLSCGSSPCQHRSSVDTLSAGERSRTSLVPGSASDCHAEPL